MSEMQGEDGKVIRLFSPIPDAQPSRQGQGAASGGIETGGDGPNTPSDMSDLTGRVSKLEGSVDGLKSSVDAMRWVIGILALVMVGGISFLGVQVTRIDGRVASLESKVDALPDKINSNLLNLTTTLSGAITAAKQQAPQVILMPSLSPAPAAGQEKK